MTPLASPFVLAALVGFHAAMSPTPPATGTSPTLPTTEPRSQPQASPEKDRREATSLLGTPLVTPPLSEARRGQLEANLELARRAFEVNPSDESAAIWYGRRLAYLGRFREAIDVYTRALAMHHDSYRLLRHRGHRYLTCRELDLAVADLTRAWDLAKDKPDAPEPDGETRPGAPTSTDKGNILYHLGLAYYFKGDFTRSAQTFGLRTELTRRNEPLSDDMLVSFLNWQYLAMMRTGDKDGATKLLAEYRPEMDVRDNDAYAALLRVYRGEVPTDVLLPHLETSASTNLAMAYGVGAFKLVSGDRAGAERVFTRLADNPAWPSFGVLAAEAELARTRTAAADAK